MPMTWTSPRAWRCLALLALAAAPSFGWACRPSGMAHEVEFAPGSTTLDARTASALAQWFVQARTRLQVWDVALFAMVGEPDAGGNARAQARMDNIIRLLQPMNSQGAAIRKVRLAHASRRKHPDGDTIFLESQPACTKDNSCCPLPIQGLAITQARSNLLKSGWLPRATYLMWGENQDEPANQSGDAGLLHRAGLSEVEMCTGVEKNFCFFNYVRDGRCLRLTTEGEFNPGSYEPMVVKMASECPPAEALPQR